MSETEDRPATKTIELTAPVSWGGKEYDRLELAEPTAGFMSKSLKESGALDIMIVLVSHVSGVPKAAVEKMPISVITEAGEYCLSFFGDGQKTGES